MKYFQLFCEKPSIGFMEEFLKCFNLYGLNETKSFVKMT